MHSGCFTSHQMSETAILANTSGSSRYQHFLSGLGQLLRLSSCDPDLVYLGGLDRGGNDGEFTYFYLRDTTQGEEVYKAPHIRCIDAQ